MIRFLLIFVLISNTAYVCASDSDADGHFGRQSRTSCALPDEYRCLRGLEETTLVKSQASQFIKTLLARYNDVENLEDRCTLLSRVNDLIVAQKDLSRNDKAHFMIEISHYMLRLSDHQPSLSLYAQQDLFKLFNLIDSQDNRWYAAIVYALTAEKNDPQLSLNSPFNWPVLLQKMSVLKDCDHNIHRQTASFVFACIAMEAHPLNWRAAEDIFTQFFMLGELLDPYRLSAARRLATIYSIGGYGVNKDLNKAISILNHLRSCIWSDPQNVLALTCEIEILQKEFH